MFSLLADDALWHMREKLKLSCIVFSLIHSSSIYLCRSCKKKRWCQCVCSSVWSSSVCVNKQLQDNNLHEMLIHNCQMWSWGWAIMVMGWGWWMEDIRVIIWMNLVVVLWVWWRSDMRFSWLSCLVERLKQSFYQKPWSSRNMQPHNPR